MTFSKVISMWVEDVKKASDEIVKEIVIDIGTQIILLTPVKTGNLRGNWRVSIGTPDTSTDRDRADKSGQQTIAAMIGGLSELTAGQVAHFANYVHYGEKIEFGGSPLKAPEGMFRISTTEERFREAVDKALSANIV